jgi:hypothetical protein
MVKEQIRRQKCELLFLPRFAWITLFEFSLALQSSTLSCFSSLLRRPLASAARFFCLISTSPSFLSYLSSFLLALFHLFSCICLVQYSQCFLLATSFSAKSFLFFPHLYCPTKLFSPLPPPPPPIYLVALFIFCVFNASFL